MNCSVVLCLVLIAPFPAYNFAEVIALSDLLLRLARRTDLPAEVVAGAPKVTVTGGDRVLVENHKGILSYTEDQVEVSCGHGRVRVRGTALLLRAMDEEMLLITGKISGVDVE